MQHHYNPWLVLASLLISTLSSWMALEISGHLHAEQRRTANLAWLAGGALTMGMGIWSMHYVGMLAFRMEVPVLYHWPTVLLSLLAAVCASACAVFLVSRPAMSWARTVAGSLIMGAGIAGMHYIGMAAMRMPCTVRYNPWLVALSVALAVVISFAALRLCFVCRTEPGLWNPRRAASALLMGCAIPTMHYVGMAAAGMQMNSAMQMDSTAVHAYTRVVAVSRLAALALIAAVIFLLCLVSFAVDLSRRVAASRKRLSKAQRERDRLRCYQQRLTRAYRQNGVGAWEYRVATGLYHVDSYLHQVFDTEDTGGPVTRESWLCRVHPDDVAPLTERWTAALEADSIYETEFRLIHRDGSIRHVHSIANIARDQHGQPRRVSGMTWDVTEDRQRQRASVEQANRFYTTLQAIGDAVISVDRNQAVLYANPVACRLTGWTSEECLGRQLVEVFVTEDESTGQRRRNPVQRCVERGGVLLSEDAVLVARTGQRCNIRKIVNLIGEQGDAVITFQDITAGRRMERALHKAATHDALTGLPNRAAFEAELQQTWNFERGEGECHALCLLDLDRFKIINDTSGHLAGDAFLRKVVEVLQAEMQPHDLLARMSGDEFLFLLKDTTIEAMQTWARNMLHAVEAIRFPWQHRVYSVTASFGIVLFDGSCPSLDALLSQADVAMYTAKRSGRNQFAFYCESDGAAAGNLLEMETVSQLRECIEQDRFELHAQPIVPINGVPGVPYFELLIRMRDKHNKLVSPALFIPAAECYGMMHHIDRWVIRHALQSYAPACARGVQIHFAINLSAASLSDPTLWTYVHQQFLEFNVPPSSVTFEVTETGMIQNFGIATSFLNNARAVGSRVALDDFGTGMSSLSYLKQFSLDVLKIDGSFIRKVASTPLDQAIVRAVTQIAHSLGASVVAECVEEMETATLLGTLGVDLVQGWATGRPELLETVLARTLNFDILQQARKPEDTLATAKSMLLQTLSMPLPQIA